MSGPPINPKVPQSKQRCLGTHKAVRMSVPGTDLPTPNVRFQGEYWGQSGLTADASESTRMPSRPGELHPEPLTEPDLTLSRHPARAIARRLPPSIEHRAPPVAGWPAPMTMACSLRSTGITPLLSYYEAVRPSPAHRYFGLAVGAACAFSLTIASQVLTFHTKAWSSFAPPTRRMPLGQSQDILRARPGRRVTPRFRHRLIRFR